MRGATQCAKKLKSFFSSLRNKLGKLSPPPTSDPITQLVLGVLSRDVPESKARAALDTLRGLVVDYNELRVIPSFELAEMLGDYPDGRTKSEDILRALNTIFAQEHDVSLDKLADMSRKDAAAYLEAVDGLEAYSRARIRLLGLQQHAIPLDEAMWAAARKAAIIDAKCPLDEAQGFLERQISADDALEFVTLLHKHAWSEFGSAVRARKVEPIQSIPPERKTSHMLADLAPQPPADELAEFDDKAAGGGKSKTKSKSADAESKAAAEKSTKPKSPAAKPAAKAKKAAKKATKTAAAAKKTTKSAKKATKSKPATKSTTKKKAKSTKSATARRKTTKSKKKTRKTKSA